MNKSKDIVKFQGTEILTFSENDQHLIAIKPLCEKFGIQWQAQYNKLQRDELFNSTISVTDTVGADGRNREMVCLPIEVFPMWLARINTSRVENPFAAEMILEFQKKATVVLYEHFFGANKLQLQKSEEKLKYLRNDNIRMFKEKIIGTDREYYYECRKCWLLWKACGSTYSKAAEYTDLSSSALSTRVKKYQHYLDATRYEREKVDGYETEEPDVFEMHQLVKDECPEWEVFKKAVAVNDLTFHKALRLWKNQQRN